MNFLLNFQNFVKILTSDIHNSYFVSLFKTNNFNVVIAQHIYLNVFLFILDSKLQMNIFKL